MVRKTLFTLASLLTLLVPACAQDLVGRASVIDGDTIEIHGTRIRLFGIDAPEGNQTCRDARERAYRCGQVAANALAEFIGTRPVTCVPKELDQYGRTVAACAVGGSDIGDWLVRRGLAVEYKRYSKGQYRSAATKRYGARVVVTSRVPIDRGDLLPIQTFNVQPPNLNAKVEIARKASGSLSVQTLKELLDTVGSGLEARMIGELGRQLRPGVSKYGLFDAYVRERLGTASSDGIRALSRIAGIMTERISFGLSVRELDRLLDREGVTGTLLQALQDANILGKRGDRISFSHEMFLNVFAAEAILRRAGEDHEKVVAALRRPQHLDAVPFVLGAIDDDGFRRQVLHDVADERVIRACLGGQCGPDAQLWASQRCDEVLERVRAEIDTVSFEASEAFAWQVQASPETVQDWSAQDRAVLAAIPHDLVAGRRVDELLELIGRMDVRIAAEHRRLLDQVGEKRLQIRTGLYAICLVGAGAREIGLTRICSPISSGHLYDGPKVPLAVNIYGRLQSETLSRGQVWFLLELDKYSDRDAPKVGAILPAIITRVWRFAPHHLRCALMHAAVMSAHALANEERRALITSIEENCMTDGGVDVYGIIDALKALGALDDDTENHVATVKAQIEMVLADRENSAMWQLANGIWNAQFDHPYDSAYWEAWNDLPDEERKALLFLAALGADGHFMFTPTLIAEMAKFNDVAAAPLIARWSVLLPKRQVMIQDAVRSYEMASAALARLKVPLPDHAADAVCPADHAMLACGQIIYWLNRDDLPLAERKRKCAPALAVLLRHEDGVAAAVIGEFFGDDHIFAESAKRLPGLEPVITSFASHFPREIAAVYRAALERPTAQSGYFEWFRPDDVAETALMILGRFGDSSDVPMLRAWTMHPSLGTHAVQAIREIQGSSRQQGEAV